MNEQQLHQLLSNIAEGLAPKETINLWPTIESQLSSPKRFAQHTYPKRVAWVTLVILLFGLVFIVTPQGRVWAQEFLHFFIRTDSDTLPLQSWQLTSQPTLAPGTTATPDPANIFFEAKLNVIQVEEQYGIDLKEPTWLPENFVIVGATFDPTHSVGRIFYSGGDYDDLVLKEEIYSSPDTCDLCDKVGESASVEFVQIGNVKGEYVQGVWNLTDSGPIWENNPYLQILRWQVDGVAYELLFQGQPDSIVKEDLVNIASSLERQNN